MHRWKCVFERKVEVGANKQSSFLNYYIIVFNVTQKALICI